MLKQCFACLLLAFTQLVHAQNNLVVLTETGSLFTLFVDDRKINDSAQSVVIARKLYDDTCRVKMVFSDNKFNEHNETVFLTVAGKPVHNKEFTYSLTHEKGHARLRFISVNDAQTDTLSGCVLPESCIKAIFTELERKKVEDDKLNERYPTPSECKQTISDSLLSTQLKLFSDNHIDMNRMKEAKWFISNHCIDSKQLMKIMETFDRTASRIRLAEFAYAYMADPGSFLDLTQALKFPSEKEELRQFYEKIKQGKKP